MNRDERQRASRDVLWVGEFVFFQDDERDPRQELESLRRRGRVPPREILVVEVDGGEVVRLEVSDPMAWLGADDRQRVDAGDVPRAVELDVLRDWLHESRAAADGGAGKLELHVDGRTRSRGRGGDGVGQPLTQPWQERVRAEEIVRIRNRLRGVGAHAATSNFGRT